jgi:hypothetical protein
MKNPISFFVLILSLTSNVFSQCTSQFTFAINSESVTFSNQSIVSNSHYYWNFGDGDGSNTTNPVHVFPDDGKYLVTLYSHDTISGCSNYVEKLITVNKPDSISCNLFFTDTIIGTNYIRTDLSTGCLPLYDLDQDVGPCTFLSTPTCFFWTGWKSSLFVAKLKAFRSFQSYPNNAYVVYKEYYKTIKRDFSPSINYQNCSANYEVTINYQTNGAVVNFAAMNRNATNYKWEITGFGWPIYYYTPSINHFFPNPPMYQKSKTWLIVLYTNDSNNNCGDTVTQNIVVRNLNYSVPVNVGVPEYGKDRFPLNIYPNPALDKITVNCAIETERIIFSNSLGQVVLFIDRPKHDEEIDVSNLPDGIYFVNAKNKHGQFYYKILKE